MKTKFHADGYVTFWDVYSQNWAKWPAHLIPNKLLATLPQAERDRIARHGEKHRFRFDD